MKKWLAKLRQAGLVKDIIQEVSSDLEAAHISYIEAKRPNPKVLFFHNIKGKKFPLVTNLFANLEVLELFFGTSPEAIAQKIQAFLQPKKPRTLSEKLDFLSQLINLKNAIPKRLNTSKALWRKSNLVLQDLPILKTWEDDGGAFITMGQVYTKAYEGDGQNLGMYRLQFFEDSTREFGGRLGLHWQIHKDGAHFYHDYAAAGCKMPVSVAVGGDPLYIWCGQAPLPKGVFELLLYGFVRNAPARLAKCQTNEIFVPYDADFVIEGFVDGVQDEGRFGDHTGFYTPIEPFPVMRVTQISAKEEAVFAATVVGKPPLEDKFMGFATERIFLPLFRTSAPDLIDYKMPENGVFHNLILAKFDSRYPAHAQQLMHAFWGVGQMSFVKHAIFVPKDAPKLEDYEALTEFVLRRFSPKALSFSSGVCDQLDHASPNACFGGKLALDASQDFAPTPPQPCEDLSGVLKSLAPEILEVKEHFSHTPNPLVFVKVRKTTRDVKQIWQGLSEADRFVKIVIFLDEDARLDNLYMCLWRAVNNIDALRDVFVWGERVCIDATSKGELEGYTREWPKMTNCTKEVVKRLVARGLLEDDAALFERFEIFG